MKDYCSSEFYKDKINYNKIACFFNIMDICIAYKYLTSEDVRYALSFDERYIIDSGLYYLPTDICPLGKSAEQLIKYADKQEERFV